MNLSQKRILIFGGTGSLGQSLLKRFLVFNQVVVLSRDESKHWTLRNEFNNKNLSHEIGDIRDQKRVASVVLKHKPNIILIASALKHVDTCENTPYESIQTNVLGISNVIDSTIENSEKLGELEAVVMISTDKACSPTNVYGMCKALAERIVINASMEHDFTRFIGVRYGNVLQSRGSIIPLFQWQVANLDKLTVTHKAMTRYVMTLDDSIDLIVRAVNEANTGEIFIPKVYSMRIIDLANIFADKYGKKIEIVGIRPGEKVHEELISLPESLRTVSDKNIFRMLPSHSRIDADKDMFSYTSADDVMERAELEYYLKSLDIFDADYDSYVGKKIEEIDTSGQPTNVNY